MFSRRTYTRTRDSRRCYRNGTRDASRDHSVSNSSCSKRHIGTAEDYPAVWRSLAVSRHRLPPPMSVPSPALNVPLSDRCAGRFGSQDCSGTGQTCQRRSSVPLADAATVTAVNVRTCRYNRDAAAARAAAKTVASVTSLVDDEDTDGDADAETDGRVPVD